MQLILINCYSQEKPIRPLNCAHLILTVSTKDANLDLKIASAIILNSRNTILRDQVILCNLLL